jgi:tetratricopeptide (TPR) repeat protein
MDVGVVAPRKPVSSGSRQEFAHYEDELSAYNRQAEDVRRKQVMLDMRQGWVLVDYFYGQFAAFEHQPEGLGEAMGEMVYGMDVDRVKHSAEQINFIPGGTGDFVTRVAKAPTGMMLAEKKMLEGHPEEAEAIADKALADPAQDHGDALYMKARAELMLGDPKSSLEGFEQVLHVSRNPHTLAWAHIYLGRLYDIKDPPERDHALTEYKAALAVPALPPDAQAAAQKGLKVAFEVPKVVHEDDQPLDPTGKAEKESYKPDAPQ